MKYRVGDKVRIIRSSYSHCKEVPELQVGSVTIITAIDENLHLYAAHSNNNSGRGYTFYEHEVELVEDMQKIEVGDTVKAKRFPRTYTVKSIGRKRYTLVEIDGWISESNVELVSKAKMKEIIGYNIKKEYEHIRAAIIRAVDAVEGQYPGGYLIKAGKGYRAELNAIELGVLDLWFEPVYKSEEVVVKLSNSKQVTIKDKDTIHINIGGYIGDIKASDIHRVHKALTGLGQIAGYNVAVKEFSLGCQTFTLSDLDKVEYALNNFK